MTTKGGMTASISVVPCPFNAYSPARQATLKNKPSLKLTSRENARENRQNLPPKKAAWKHLNQAFRGFYLQTSLQPEGFILQGASSLDKHLRHGSFVMEWTMVFCGCYVFSFPSDASKKKTVLSYGALMVMNPMVQSVRHHLKQIQVFWCAKY